MTRFLLLVVNIHPGGVLPTLLYVLFIFVCVCVQKIAVAWTGMVKRLLERLRTNHAWFWTKVVDAIAVCMCTCKRDGVSSGERWCCDRV